MGSLSFTEMQLSCCKCGIANIGDMVKAPLLKMESALMSKLMILYAYSCTQVQNINRCHT